MYHSWHTEPHFTHRSNWLRASVLGANDGLISTASLLMGLASAGVQSATLMLIGFSALVAGAISMAAGEYVSVSSQSDTEQADLDKEIQLLQMHPEKELKELTKIYEKRGLNKQLAHQVAVALTEHDALDAHARDELGITDINSANPIQASIFSGMSFSLGAIVPILIATLVHQKYTLLTLTISTLLGLMLLGFISAKLGGAKIVPAVFRILLWGVLALFVTFWIGQLFAI